MPRSRSRSPPKHSHRERDRPRRDYDDSYRKRRRSRSEDRYNYRSFRREDRRPRGPEESDQKRHRSRSRSPKLSQRATGSEVRTGVQERKDDRGSKSKSRSASPEPDKAKPNFKPSGLLAAATNTVKHEGGKSTILKYNEPPEARKPTQTWRLYVFKGAEETDALHISRQSAYLVGRDRLVADIPLDHPSCSKQHAAFQFRSITARDEFGSVKTKVKPFIIDLESTNGTHVNNEEIPTARYYELKSGDVVKFGLSTREYVILLDPDS